MPAATFVHENEYGAEVSLDRSVLPLKNSTRESWPSGSAAVAVSVTEAGAANVVPLVAKVTVGGLFVAVDTVTAGEGAVRLTFRVEEGRRLAVSGIQVIGNSSLSASEIVGSLKTRPEGFWWWRRGEFDEDKYDDPTYRDELGGYYSSSGS